MPSPPNDLVALGRLIRPHGVRGAMLLAPYADNVSLVMAKGPAFWLLPPNGGRPLPAEGFSARPAASGLLAVISGCADREAALAFKGWELALSRREFPPTEEDEYYWTDLLGLAVETTAGRPLGRVRNFMEAGAGLILVAAPDEAPDREALIPFQEAFIAEVDLAAGKIVIEAVPGLLGDLDEPGEPDA